MGPRMPVTKKPYCLWAVTGLILGFIPGAVIAFTSLVGGHGHGSDALNLAALAVVGIPGMAIGCFVGAFLQHRRTKPARYLSLPIGGPIGSIVGVFLALFLLGDYLGFLLAPYGERAAASAGLLAGGIVGTLVASYLTGRRAEQDAAPDRRGAYRFTVRALRRPQQGTASRYERHRCLMR
jgi:hypothetical protein